MSHWDGRHISQNCYLAYLERGQHRFAMNDEMNTHYLNFSTTRR
jgi:hypothetical protein